MRNSNMADEKNTFQRESRAVLPKVEAVPQTQIDSAIYVFPLSYK